MTGLRFPAARVGCGVVRGTLPDGLLDPGPVAAMLSLHLETCLACQADLRPARRVATAMAALAVAPRQPAPRGFVEAVMAELAGSGGWDRRRRRRWVGWSAAGAVSAMVAAVVVAAARRRVSTPAALGGR